MTASLSAARAVAALVMLATPVAASAVPTITAMRSLRRVLIVATPTLADARLMQQRRALAGWQRGARDRDLSLVEVSGTHVIGAGDGATLLRRRWHLPPGEFQVVLVGKDGHEAFRARHPMTAAALQRTIDAMPMRRAGHR